MKFFNIMIFRKLRYIYKKFVIQENKAHIYTYFLLKFLILYLKNNNHFIH